MSANTVSATRDLRRNSAAMVARPSAANKPAASARVPSGAGSRNHSARVPQALIGTMMRTETRMRRSAAAARRPHPDRALRMQPGSPSSRGATEAPAL